jgi:hypothetical protein
VADLLAVDFLAGGMAISLGRFGSTLLAPPGFEQIH